MKIWWFVVGAFVAAALMLNGTYNDLVRHDENVGAKMGAVQAQEQRRFDLIPNLVHTVEASANYERGVLTEVTQARAHMGDLLKANPSEIAHNPELQKQFFEAQQQMSGALSRFMVTVEAYPALKATEGFLTLQAQLEGTENRIATARRDVQEATSLYNSTRRSFPFGTLASVLGGFKEISYFQSVKGSENPPVVQFNLQTSK